MLKIREAMSSCENFPLNSEVHVDDFVLGGKETNKAGRSYNSKKKRAIALVQNTENGKVKKIYAMKIEEFYAQSLLYIFIKNISKKASVVTDKQRGYRPMAEANDTIQIENNKGYNFKVLHTMIHQVKLWIRTTYS